MDKKSGIQALKLINTTAVLWYRQDAAFLKHSKDFVS